ncbi:hypothetical protein V493_07621 [Pseudogymnoascus sp. VKM F-4281 (FW-2241)]|nr:hypothetical protein V493_07621 [Pseudogymnoascus sp. VKM F-4281 (FW-2241)]
MTKSLRRIPQLLTTPRNLLRKHAQMIRKTQNILKHIHRSSQILLIIHPRPRHRLHKPERAHTEGALVAAYPVVGLCGVVAVDEPGAGEAAFFGREEDAVHGAEEAGVVGRDEEDEGGDED